MTDNERDAQAVASALRGHFTPGIGGCARCRKGFDALDRLVAALSAATTERDEARQLATHLFGMIDRELWRATGGDDGQGHYEGDYRAEKIAAEIDGWVAAAAPATTLNEPEAAREAAVLADVLAGRNPETWASLHRPLDHLREQEIRRLVFGGELYRWGTEATAIEDLLREIDRLRAAAAAVPNEAEQGQ